MSPDNKRSLGALVRFLLTAHSADEMGLQKRFGATLNERAWRQLFWSATEVCRLQHGIEWAPKDGSGSGVRIRADADRTVRRASHWESKGRIACIRSAERYAAVAAATQDEEYKRRLEKLASRARERAIFTRHRTG
jgi:hypothetical protein